jgi:hypothetical protein
MTDGEKVINELSKILKAWDFSFIDSLGRSGGISLDGKKGSFSLGNSWDFVSWLGTVLLSLDLGK